MSEHDDVPEVPPVLARWVGPDVVNSPAHGTLIPGETIVEIGAHEAVQSDHWEPVEPVALPDPESEQLQARVDELVKSSREDLDARAVDAGIPDPASYPNKTELARAIVAAEES